MKHPQKAIVLAAGLGTRMRPLSAAQTKAMMPFSGAPIIEHTIAQLKQWGVTDILINLHHAPSSLVEHVRTRPFDGMKISFSFEPEIRGTGGAIKQAQWFIGNEPFWIINSDIVFELNPSRILRAFEARHPLACLWVTSSDGPRTVERNQETITCFSSSEPKADHTVTFCGVHLVSPEIMNYISNETFSSIIFAYKHAILKKESLLGIEEPSSYWADIGSPEKLISCHAALSSARSPSSKISEQLKRHVNRVKRSLKRRGVSVSGFVTSGGNIEVSPSSTLENCILGNGVTIQANSSLRNCIVSEGLKVKGKLERAVVPLSEAFDLEDIRALTSCASVNDAVFVEALPPRGSDRALFRLHGGSHQAILIKYDAETRPENGRFTQNLKFIDSLGLPVPALIHDIPRRSICIVEDLGNASLQSEYTDIPQPIMIELYMKVIRFASVLHSKGAILARKQRLKLEPTFDRKLYEWERNLFAEHYLKGTLGLDNRVIEAVLAELEQIPAELREEKSLIHRDLQSSNILLKAGRPVFIDFQGMRFGSRYYDIASLLFDPYVSLPLRMRKQLILEYAETSGIQPERAERLTYIAGIQRLAQALGAFGRLSKIDGMQHFRDYFKPASQLMGECLTHTLNFPVLAKLISQ